MSTSNMPNNRENDLLTLVDSLVIFKNISNFLGRGKK